MPERTGRVGDGIAEGTGTARQARTAQHGQTGAEAPMLIDQVVSRENLIRAHTAGSTKSPAAPDPGPRTGSAQQRGSGRGRHGRRRPDAVLPGTLVPHAGRNAERHVPPPTGPEGGDPQAGREGHANAGHPDRTGSPDPASLTPGPPADLRPDVLGSARTRRCNVPATTSRRVIAGRWTWIWRSSSTG